MASVLYLALLVSLSCVLWNGADAVCRPPPTPPPPQSTPSSCRPGWSEYGNRCFLFQNTTADWATAERACIDLGGNLASIHNSDEHIFLKNLVKSKLGSYPRTWVGGHDAVKEGVWLWSDGSKFSFSQWGSGQPDNYGGNEHCLEINHNGAAVGTNDIPCSTKFVYICAKKA